MVAQDIYLKVTDAEWSEALTYCCENDVEKGGCFDARSLAINVWSHPWNTPGNKAKSKLLASFYPRFRWSWR